MVQYFDFTKLVFTSTSIFCFRHYVRAHRTGLRIKSKKLHRSGEVDLFSFLEGLSFGSWHFDWFSILISLNWRERQARSFAFGITLSTEQGCPYSLEKHYWGRLNYFHFSRTCLLAAGISIGSVF